MDTRTTLNGRIHTDKDKKREKWVHAFNRKNLR
ncbi:unknown [Bacteroides sp. CAG:633]|nr:unknown [Bacteroides sp. CAG:633]